MSLLKVLSIPDPRLKVKANPVEKVDESVRRLMDDMLETMYAGDGSGLAASQVGVNKRVVVIDVEQTEVKGKVKPGRVYKMANPEIIWGSEEKVRCDEGCLSVPECSVSVERAAEVHVIYLDENNTPQKVEASSKLARCLQHEIDHLNGVLITDYLSSLKREMLLRKLKKARLLV